MTTIAEEIFRHINEAHAVLADPTTRKAYEEDLDGGGGRKEALGALEAEFSFQKGVVFFRKKNFAEARRSFEEAWSLNDKEGEHLAWLAWTQYHDPRLNKNTELPKIKDLLLRALKISPQNPICHYFLGEIYLALGDDKRARTCFTRTVEIQANHVEANRHLRLMQMRKDKLEKKDKGLFGGLLKKK
jgi:tetratricopeptide (TPR) repeat protein